MAKKKKEGFLDFIWLYIVGFLLVFGLSLFVPKDFYLVAAVLLFAVVFVVDKKALSIIRSVFRVSPKKVLAGAAVFLAFLVLLGTTPAALVNGAVVEVGSVLQLGAITGALEGGDTAVTAQQVSYPGVGVTMTLLSDTIIKPNEKFSASFLAEYGSTSTVNNNGWIGLQIEKGNLADNLLLRTIIQGSRDNGQPTQFSLTTPPVAKANPGKYRLKLLDYGNNPNNRTVLFTSHFSPDVSVWFVDDRCLTQQDFFPVVQTFQSGSIIDNSQFKVLNQSVTPAFFCYDNQIVKYKPDQTTQKSVAEFAVWEEGGSITLPQDEVWIVPYNVNPADVPIAQTCTADTITQAETGECTIDISLISECGGQVDFTTGTCITQGFNPCPPGQLLFVDEGGEQVCVVATQVTFDSAGNKFTCGLASILNEDTKICETPSNLAPSLCDASQIRIDGICEKDPLVECANPDEIWSQLLVQCIVQPTEEQSCTNAGFNWNSLAQVCSVGQIFFSGNPSADCERAGGAWDSPAGVCIVTESELVEVLVFRERPPSITGFVELFPGAGDVSLTTLLLFIFGAGIVSFFTFQFLRIRLK